MTYCTPGQAIACTGSPDSILHSLRLAGIKEPKILVDWSSHAVRIQIGAGDSGPAAAKVLWETLPAGVATQGSESYLFTSGGDLHTIRLSRDNSVVDPTEPYDRRGRVHQPLSQGWMQVNPPDELSFLATLRGQGVVAWDLHKRDDHSRLFVDGRAEAGHLLEELVLVHDGHDEPWLEELLASLGVISVHPFEFKMPKQEDPWMTAHQVADLLGMPVSMVLGMTVDYEVTDLFRKGPGHATITRESFDRFLVGRGFYRGPSWNPSPDPYAYYLHNVSRGS